MHRLHERTGSGLVTSGVGRFVGCLSEEELVRALPLLQQRHASLRLVIEDRGHKARFVEPESPRPLELCWSIGQNLDQWSERVVSQARQGFDPQRGPLLRFEAIYYPRHDITDLIVTSHHAVLDGTSRLTLLRELVQILAGETLAPSCDQQSRLVPAVPRKQGLWKPLLKAVGRRIKLMPQVRRWPFIGPDVKQGTEELVRRRVWTREATHKLREEAKRQGTTVFGALAAAAVESLCELRGVSGRTAKVCSTLNFRPLCEPPLPRDSVGCYATLLDFLLPGVGKVPFWDLARRSRQQVELVISTGLWAATWYGLGKLLKQGWRPPLKPNLCTVNNLGALEGLSSEKIQLLEYGWTVNQQDLANDVMLAAITVHGVLNLTIRSPWHTPEEIEHLFDLIYGKLAAASTGAFTSGQDATNSSRPSR